MGDIFWGYQEDRDAKLGFVEPSEVAHSAVATTLQKLADSLESSSTYPASLQLEYREVVERAGGDPDEAAIIRALVEHASWTDEGAATVAKLASAYGTSVLRSALALAEALDIEDGSAGM